MSRMRAPSKTSLSSQLASLSGPLRPPCIRRSQFCGDIQVVWSCDCQSLSRAAARKPSRPSGAVLAEPGGGDGAAGNGGDEGDAVDQAAASLSFMSRSC